jgi:hypothetical protein
MDLAYNSPPQYLVFNHIPKCGGTSFRRMIYRACLKNDGNNFYEQPIYISDLTHNNITLGQESNVCIKKIIHPKTKVFVDHSKYLQIENIFDLNKSLTYRSVCVRNPIDRIISHNEFFCRIPIDDLLNNEKSLDALIYDCGKLYMNYVTYNINASDQEKYDIAKDIYKNCYNFIFHLHTLDKDIEIFNKTNPFNLKLNNIITNKSSNKPNYPNDLIEKIKSKIPLEIDLYNYILQLRTQGEYVKDQKPAL